MLLDLAMTVTTPCLTLFDATTDRLHLREFVIKDATDIFVLNSNPEMTRYQSWDPLKEEQQAVRWVESATKAQLENPRTSFALVVASKEDGTFMGNIGAEVDYENLTTEVWYSMVPKFHSKGYAREAMTAMLPLLPVDHTFEIECDPKNTPSRKLAEYLGFQEIYHQENVSECKGGWVGVVKYVKK